MKLLGRVNFQYTELWNRHLYDWYIDQKEKKWKEKDNTWVYICYKKEASVIEWCASYIRINKPAQNVKKKKNCFLIKFLRYKLHKCLLKSFFLAFKEIQENIHTSQHFIKVTCILYCLYGYL